MEPVCIFGEGRAATLIGERSLVGTADTDSREGLGGSDPSIEEIDMLLSGRLMDDVGGSREVGNEGFRGGPRVDEGWIICCACGICGDEGGSI